MRPHLLSVLAVRWDTENQYLWDMWGCLWCIDHIGLPTDKRGMSSLGPPCSSSWLIYEGTIPCRPCVSCTDAWQGHWPWLALFFLLFTSPKSQVAGWKAGHSPWWVIPLMQLSGLNHTVFYLCQSPQSQVCHVSPHGRWPQAVMILAYVNCSWTQKFIISKLQPA